MGEPPPAPSERIVGIDARLRSGQPGGVEQFVVGLAHGLSRLTDGEERYLFQCLPGEESWLRPYLGGRCELVTRSPLRTVRQWVVGSLPRYLIALAPRLRVIRRVLFDLFGRLGAGVPQSDGSFEAVRAKLVHFPTQSAFATELPTIYQPWDLQHLHFPSFFGPEVIASRETRYRAFCARATKIVVPSRWGKDDLIRQYGVPPDKVVVIPVPGPLAAYDQLTEEQSAAIARKLELPSAFLLYPAQTWPHKNHARLFEALSVVMARSNLALPLLCTGTRNQHFPAVERAVYDLGLGGQVRFMGYLSAREMRVLYRNARGLVFPSLFEGWGLPVVEALGEGLPVACARVTSIPDIVGDAAILFDPMDVRDMADAIERLWTDERLRTELMARGRERVSDLTWDKTARTYRALYRSVAGWPLSESDTELLAALG